VVIVDDDPTFRRLLRRLLAEDGLDVVGEAAHAGEAIAVVPAIRPEIVLVDVHLPDLDGFALAHELRDSGAAIILISSRPAGEFRRRIAAAPARGYIAKEQLSGPAILALAGREP
jgi:two-component system nitrate/nitrite response regulator NarL